MKLTLNSIKLNLILLYPFLLGVIVLIGFEPFFIESPFFLILLVASLGIFIFTSKSNLKIDTIVLLLFLFFLIVVYNYNGIRYSRPVFFSLFCLLYYFILKNEKYSLNFEAALTITFYAFIILSIFCLFFDNFYTHDGRFYSFIGSPTIFSGFISLLFSVVSIQYKNFKKYFFIFILVFVLVYLSKTRLILIFLLIHPIINYVIFRKNLLSIKKIFTIIFLVTVFLYPVYQIVVIYLPQLIEIRYKSGKDPSFGLRYFIYNTVMEDISSKNFSTILFGNGAEHSRLLVLEKTGDDNFPHNDYLRIISDFGITGFLIFSIFLYRIAVKNIYTINIAIIYMILFYSNMIYSLFIITILFFYYFKPENND